MGVASICANLSDMALIGQLIFDGFAMGLIYVLLAAGNVLICSVNKVIMVCYGVFYTIGSYFMWWLFTHAGMPYFAATIFAAIGTGIVGVVSYVLAFQKHQMRITQGGFLATMIVSMGLNMVLSQLILIIFGTTSQSVPSVFPGRLSVFGVSINWDKVMLIVSGIAVTMGLFYVYRKTRIGRSMRAVAQDAEAASLQGIDANLVYMFSMGIACATAGLAGCLIAPSYGIDPSMGNNIVWTVMLMTMFGGKDSLPGAVIGGLVIGQILSFGQYYIGGIVQIIVFFVIGVLLYFRPNGLLGHYIDIGI